MGSLCIEMRSKISWRSERQTELGLTFNLLTDFKFSSSFTVTRRSHSSDSWKKNLVSRREKTKNKDYSFLYLKLIEKSHCGRLFDSTADVPLNTMRCLYLFLSLPLSVWACLCVYLRLWNIVRRHTNACTDVASYGCVCIISLYMQSNYKDVRNKSDEAR